VKNDELQAVGIAIDHDDLLVDGGRDDDRGGQARIVDRCRYIPNIPDSDRYGSDRVGLGSWNTWIGGDLFVLDQQESRGILDDMVAMFRGPKSKKSCR
jgi:hypothetical protein